LSFFGQGNFYAFLFRKVAQSFLFLPYSVVQLLAEVYPKMNQTLDVEKSNPESKDLVVFCNLLART